MRIGLGHQVLWAARSLAKGKESIAADCPSQRPPRPQGVVQRIL